MDTQTKMKAEKDLATLYQARLVILRYLIEHQRMLQYKRDVDVTPNIEYLKIIRPAYKHLKKVFELFEKEYIKSLKV